MAPAIEVEPHTMVEDRPPARQVELALDQPRQAVVGGPTIKKKPVLGHPLAESRQVPLHQAMFTEGKMYRMQLMATVPAILLALAGHTVHKRFLGAVVECVDTGVEQPLQRRLVRAHECLVGPGKDATAHANLADYNPTRGVVNVKLQPP